MAKIDLNYLVAREQDYPVAVRRMIAKYRQSRNNRTARRNSKESAAWFAKEAGKSRVNAKPIMNAITRSNDKEGFKLGKGEMVGRMFLFEYDAKHKDTLPHWDRYPLVFMFNTFIGDGKTWGDKGVLYLQGLNVHYLPPRLRLILFAQLMKHKTTTGIQAKTRLKLSWDVIKSFAMNKNIAKHCVKTYRIDHLRSTFIPIHPDTWEVVMFLPLAKFVGANKSTVYRSMKR